MAPRSARLRQTGKPNTKSNLNTLVMNEGPARARSRIQNPPPLRACRFESGLGYQHLSGHITLIVAGGRPDVVWLPHATSGNFL